MVKVTTQITAVEKTNRASGQMLHWLIKNNQQHQNQRSHNLRKFPQIYAVSMGVVLVIMRILCILFKSLLLSHSQPPSPYRNTDMEISCESADQNITEISKRYDVLTVKDNDSVYI